MFQRLAYAAIGLIVLGLFGLAIYTFFRGQIGIRPAAPKVLSLVDYYASDSSAVRFTIEGPTTANEYHNSVSVTISKAKRSVEGFKTYADTPAVAQEFSNNQPAYEDFMRALQDAGFMTSRTVTGGANEIGRCPTGQRYIYELINDAKTVQRTWSTACGDVSTFNGDSGTVRSLMQAQIPGYNNLVKSISLNGSAQ